MNQLIKKAALKVPKLKELYQQREELLRQQEMLVNAMSYYQNQADLLSQLHEEVVTRKWNGCPQGGAHMSLSIPTARDRCRRRGI